MADQSDVAAALAALISSALYPSGTTQPSITGAAVRVYRGWPINNIALNSDLTAGITNVSVFPMPGMTQNVNRYPPRWTTTQGAVVLTATLAAGGASITFAGTANASHVVGVIQSNTGYAYRALPSDTPATIVAALAAEIPGATASGAVLSGGPFTSVQIVADASGVAEVGRQKDGFQVSIWAPSETARSAVSSAIKPALDGLTNNIGQFSFRLPLPDGTTGYVHYVRTNVSDGGENANLYRRDLIYSVEYPTTLTQAFPNMLFGSVELLTNVGAVATFGVQDPAGYVLVDVIGNLIAGANGEAFISPDLATGPQTGPFLDQYGQPVTAPAIIPQ